MDSVQVIDSFEPSADNGRALRDALGCFATGVTVVTVQSEDGPVAITANSFSSVSLDPALVLWSIDQNARRATYFTQAKHFAIHVLDASQEALCWSVAKNKSDFATDDMEFNANGVPLIDGALARFECRTFEVHPAGDHHIILGQIEKVQVQAGGEALAFFRGQVGRFMQGADADVGSS